MVALPQYKCLRLDPTNPAPAWGEDLARLGIGNPDAERSSQLITRGSSTT